MPFKPGVSGNPKGRTPLSSSRAVLRESLHKDVPTILKKLVSLARAGDVQAARILLDRVLPALRPEGAVVLLPDVAAATTTTEQAALIVKAAARGELPADVAGQLLMGLGQAARIAEADELARRIAALEQRGKE
jgi:thioredoxin-like negative regulator of GroEL